MVVPKLELNDKGIPTKLFAIPYYFLISHAAELFLKAALLKRGFTEAELKKYDYRHNLNSLLQELKSKGVTVTSGTTKLVDGLHEQHRTHALRYTAMMDDGKPTYMPAIPWVDGALEELLMLTRIFTQGV